MALMVSCYMPLRHFIVPTGVLWLSKWQAIKAFRIAWTPARIQFVSSLLHYLHELDRQMQPS